MKKYLRIIAVILLIATIVTSAVSCDGKAPADTSAAGNGTSSVPDDGTEEPDDTAKAPETAPVPADTGKAEEKKDEVPVLIEPDEIIEKKLYYTNGSRQADVANGKIFRYNVVEGRKYVLTSSLTAQDGGFPLVCYFNDKDKLVGTEFMNTPTQRIEAVEEELHVPATASYIFVNARGVDAIMMSGKRTSAAAEASSAKDISILFVGNSLTQDGIAYLPYILKNYYPEVNFRFYMWYLGGKALADHYSYFTNNQLCDIFSVAENTVGWSNSQKTMSWVLEHCKFDVVCMQEYFNYKSDYTEADLRDWNNCRDYIVSNYKGGNGLKFITLVHAPKRDRAEDIFNLTLKGNRLILEKTVAEDVLPLGFAVTGAMKTNLDNLGDQKHLSPDGTHAQEGLPCLPQTYVALLWLLDRLGIEKSVYGLPVKINQQIYSMINVPGANPGSGVITGSDADNLLAQEVAIMAYKEAKQLFGN